MGTLLQKKYISLFLFELSRCCIPTTIEKLFMKLADKKKSSVIERDDFLRRI